MSNLKVIGQKKLIGEVAVSGNKNAALPCLTAGLLLSPNAPANLIINNLPGIRDVRILIDILTNMGLAIDQSKLGQATIANLTYSPTDETFSIPPEEARKFRGAILMLGPLLRSFKNVVVPQVGGCKIGPRPIDTHLQNFADLGIDTTFQADAETYTLSHHPAKEKIGYTHQIWQKEASVTATENLLLYLATNPQIKSTITVVNAACEPHVQTLSELLIRMGGNITGLGTNRLTVSPSLKQGGEWQIHLEPDYIEALTYAVAAAITHSDITISHIHQNDLTLINWYLNQMGVYTRFTRGPDRKFYWKIFGSVSHLEINPSLRDIKAEPWPGLPTDALAPLIILATQCKGEVEFVDYMYNGRLTNLISALQRMGADIISLGNRSLEVGGPHTLVGQKELSPDLRNGVALVLAGLCAEGETTIQNFEIVERGYDSLPEKLLALGAQVEKS